MVVGRILTPPAAPVLAPLAACRAEHVAAHDRRADPLVPSPDEPVVDARIAAALAIPLTPRARREDPLVQSHAADAERMVMALIGAGRVPVERHRKVVHTELGHGGLNWTGWQRCQPYRRTGRRGHRGL